ncbi:putative protein IDA [Cocos nucifera]|uniref:Uncharacterized protein n=1 Tax=Cocos nucifera TaxID=13894 RepID=A0A8K0IML5_COCNU|nr:putative protein IDA [Cocos nucifera]
MAAPKVLLLPLFFLIFLAILPFSCHGSMHRIPLLPFKANEGHLSFKIEKLPAFNFLPKGTPIPPSGPSKRHNAIDNSAATDRSKAP